MFFKDSQCQNVVYFIIISDLWQKSPRKTQSCTSKKVQNKSLKYPIIWIYMYIIFYCPGIIKYIQTFIWYLTSEMPLLWMSVSLWVTFYIWIMHETLDATAWDFVIKFMTWQNQIIALYNNYVGKVKPFPISICHCNE